MCKSVEENLVIYSVVNGISRSEVLKVASPRKVIPELKFTLQTLCALMMKMKMFFGGFLYRKYVFLSKVFSFSVMTFVGWYDWQVECKYYISSSLQFVQFTPTQHKHKRVCRLSNVHNFTSIPLTVFFCFFSGLVCFQLNWSNLITLLVCICRMVHEQFGTLRGSEVKKYSMWYKFSRLPLAFLKLLVKNLKLIFNY